MACRNGYFSEVSRLYLWDIFAALMRLFVRDVLARCHFQHSTMARGRCYFAVHGVVDGGPPPTLAQESNRADCM